MLFNFDETVRFNIYGGSVDMRKGIHSLYSLVKTSPLHSALSGDVFVFVGSSRKSIKMLRWQKEGFVLYHKKLEAGLYSLPRKLKEGAFVELSSDELHRMVCCVKHRSQGSELRRAASLFI